MINNNCRRQPTPTDILDSDLFTEFDKLVFLYIWSRVRSKDGPVYFMQAGKNYSIDMKRGQVIVKVASLAKILNCDRKSIDKTLERLGKRYSQMESKGMPFGLLITWVSYDEIVNMGSEKGNDGEMTGKGKGSKGEANKTVESVETVETVKKTFGSFQNVKLKLVEVEKLKEKFPDREDKIEDLSLYLSSKGDKYKDHYATILSWSRNSDKKEKEKEPTTQEERYKLMRKMDIPAFRAKYGEEKTAYAKMGF